MTDQLNAEELENLDKADPEETGDTQPPQAGEPHGFLEQFESFAVECFQELENVVSAGLTGVENETLIKVAAKLVNLAKVHDPNAVARLLTLVQ